MADFLPSDRLLRKGLLLKHNSEARLTTTKKALRDNGMIESKLATVDSCFDLVLTRLVGQSFD